MKQIALYLLAIVGHLSIMSLLACAVETENDPFSGQRREVSALAKLVDPPAMRDANLDGSTDELKAIYFDALDWQGKPTKVFAWLGVPKTIDGPRPAIVLVHGGGGTAFKEWVQKWNDRGFAAIGIAVEGQTDARDASNAWRLHDWPGPQRVGIYGDSEQLLKDQWMYHAVADTVLANSLLRSLPQVDPDKIGLMGISWGGVITSTVIGIDGRFAFAIPTYGCGDLASAENQYGQALGNNDVYKSVWDPMLRLHQAEMPTQWLSWPGDQHFPLDNQAACYKKMPGQTMVSLIPGMNHSHAAGWNPPDSYAFAQSVVESGKPWCRQTDLQADGTVRVVSFASEKPLQDALLVSTVDSGITGSRTWKQTPASLVQTGGVWQATATLPAGTTAWFINAHADGCTVSSAYTEAE